MKYAILVISFLICILGNTAANAKIVCVKGPYLEVRENAKEAYDLRHNQDLQEILLDNPPDIDRIFSGCIGNLIAVYEKARKLVFGKIGLYTASAVIIDILENQARKLIERQCQKILIEAQEKYGDIADIIPEGDYWIDFDKLVANAAAKR